MSSVPWKHTSPIETVLRVDDAARGDDLVCPTHAGALQRPIGDDASDRSGAFQLRGRQDFAAILELAQYLITQAQAAKFRDALAAVPAPDLHPMMAKAMREGAQSQLAELEAQLAEYDALRSGKIATFKVDSIAGIGLALIKARIARQLTHKLLADRMNLAEQQIQRYEATQYAGASIERLQQVADALGLRVNEVITLEKD